METMASLMPTVSLLFSLLKVFDCRFGFLISRPGMDGGDLARMQIVSTVEGTRRRFDVLLVHLTARRSLPPLHVTQQTALHSRAATPAHTALCVSACLSYAQLQLWHRAASRRQTAASIASTRQRSGAFQCRRISFISRVQLSCCRLCCRSRRFW